MGDSNLPQPRWDVEAATKLVEAVREAGGKIPTRFEKPLDESDPNQMDQWRAAMSELADSTSCAFTRGDAWSELTTPNWWSARVKALSKIKGQLHRLNKVLSEEPLIADKIDTHLSLDFPPIDDALPELIKAVHAIEEQMAPEQGQSRKTPPLPDVATTEQAAVIQALAETYREFFETAPESMITKTWEGYGGAFVAFVRGAFSIAGETKTDDALTKAIQRAF